MSAQQRIFPYEERLGAISVRYRPISSQHEQTTDGDNSDSPRLAGQQAWTEEMRRQHAMEFQAWVYAMDEDAFNNYLSVFREVAERIHADARASFLSTLNEILPPSARIVGYRYPTNQNPSDARHSAQGVNAVNPPTPRNQQLNSTRPMEPEPRGGATAPSEGVNRVDFRGGYNATGYDQMGQQIDINLLGPLRIQQIYPRPESNERDQRGLVIHAIQLTENPRRR